MSAVVSSTVEGERRSLRAGGRSRYGGFLGNATGESHSRSRSRWPVELANPVDAGTKRRYVAVIFGDSGSV